MELHDQQVFPAGVPGERQVRAVELPEPWRSSAVTVVLPTYQEADNIPVIVDALLRLPLPNLRVLVADDNSPDGTGRIAEELAGRHDRLTVVHRPGKEGLGRAYIDGMTRAIAAGAEFVVQMDADLSHGPEYLPGMLGTLLSAGADDPQQRLQLPGRDELPCGHGQPQARRTADPLLRPRRGRIQDEP
jgi:dolichol-phosphate mannosyltransferase